MNALPPPPLLALSDVHVAFGRRVALADVSLDSCDCADASVACAWARELASAGAETVASTWPLATFWPALTLTACTVPDVANERFSVSLGSIVPDVEIVWSIDVGCTVSSRVVAADGVVDALLPLCQPR